MIDNFSGLLDEMKYSLITSLQTQFPQLKVLDNASNYSTQDEPSDFKVCRVKFNYWRDNQRLSVTGNLGITLFYGSPENIERDIGLIREYLLGEERKIFSSTNYKVWFSFSHDYDTTYFPEFREFQTGSLYEFRATMA